jgi:hypothetical protein
LYLWRWYLLHVVKPDKNFMMRQRQNEKGFSTSADLVLPWWIHASQASDNSWKVDFCAGENLSGTKLMRPLVHMLKAGPLEADVFFTSAAYIVPEDVWVPPAELALLMSAKEFRKLCAIHQAAFVPSYLFTQLAQTSRHKESTRKTVYSSVAGIISNRTALGSAAELIGLGTPSAPIHGPSGAESSYKREIEKLRINSIPAPSGTVLLSILSLVSHLVQTENLADLSKLEFKGIVLNLGAGSMFLSQIVSDQEEARHALAKGRMPQARLEIPFLRAVAGIPLVALSSVSPSIVCECCSLALKLCFELSSISGTVLDGSQLQLARHIFDRDIEESQQLLLQKLKSQHLLFCSTTISECKQNSNCTCKNSTAFVVDSSNCVDSGSLLAHVLQLN